MVTKTVRYRLDAGDGFDREVNNYLKDGWILRKKYVLPSRHDGAYTMLIAEMVKLDPSEIKAKPKDEAPERTKEEIPVIRIKYFSAEEEIEPLWSPVGDWIDLRSAETISFEAGEYKLIRLGVGMILPDGYEALVVPRSSTFKNFGIIQANSVGVIDNSYSGNNDEWHFPAIALRDTVINAGDRICQFRIIKNQPAVEFFRTETLNETDRGGIGSTGRR